MPDKQPKAKVEKAGKRVSIKIQDGGAALIFDKKNPTNADIMAALKLLYERR